jgi:hypothetical protein
MPPKFRYSFVLLSVLIATPPARAEESVDGIYLSEEVSYRDMQAGMVPVAKQVQIEFSVSRGDVQYIRVQSPVLQGTDQLYYSVRGMDCVYSSLGYPVLYPGSTIKLKTKRALFEVKYDASGNNIFADVFVVTNLDDRKTQTYRWQQQNGQIRFEHAPLKYAPLTKTYSFQVNPTLLPENFAGHYQQQGELNWLNEMVFTLSPERAYGTLTLGCPDLQFSYHLKKTDRPEAQGK